MIYNPTRPALKTPSKIWKSPYNHVYFLFRFIHRQPRLRFNGEDGIPFWWHWVVAPHSRSIFRINLRLYNLDAEVCVVHVINETVKIVFIIVIWLFILSNNWLVKGHLILFHIVLFFLVFNEQLRFWNQNKFIGFSLWHIILHQVYSIYTFVFFLNWANFWVFVVSNKLKHFICIFIIVNLAMSDFVQLLRVDIPICKVVKIFFFRIL